MDEFRDPLGTRLDVLARELEDVRRRLDRLEVRLRPFAEAPPREDAGARLLADEPPGSPFAGGPAGTVALVGRTFLVLGGAVYPTLAAGALKLLVEDLARGRPITLFVGFALYGAALVAVARLMRGEPEESAEPAGGAG